MRRSPHRNTRRLLKNQDSDVSTKAAGVARQLRLQETSFVEYRLVAPQSPRQIHGAAGIYAR